MSEYEYLKILNSLDCDYDTVLKLVNGESTELVIPNEDSVVLCKFYSDSPVTDCDEDDELEDCAYGIAVDSFDEKFLIGLDEDGNIMSNEGGIAFEMDYFYNISTTEELDSLIENGDVSRSVYDAISVLGIILA